MHKMCSALYFFGNGKCMSVIPTLLYTQGCHQVSQQVALTCVHSIFVNWLALRRLMRTCFLSFVKTQVKQ